MIHKWYDYLEDFPFSLIEEKIKEYQIKPNSLIVEPFAGSGTTLKAAKDLGRRYVGYEINKKYVSLVKKKLAC